MQYPYYAFECIYIIYIDSETNDFIQVVASAEAACESSNRYPWFFCWILFYFICVPYLNFYLRIELIHKKKGEEKKEK